MTDLEINNKKVWIDYTEWKALRCFYGYDTTEVKSISEQEIIVNTRSEFNIKIKELFIPYLVNTDQTYLINIFKNSGLFNKWDQFFYYTDATVITVKLI